MLRKTKPFAAIWTPCGQCSSLKIWQPGIRILNQGRQSERPTPSIATSALGIGPGDLMNDLKTFGLLFEALCIRDLRIYAQPLGGEIFHYRDKNGLECDAVCHLPDGRYGLIEIKLGGEKMINEGAKNLLSLASKIDTGKMPATAFMMVLTATGAFAYRRDDGIIVAPATTLGA